MRDRVMRVVAAQVLLLLTLAVPASAQEEGGRITGIVRSADGSEPVAGVEISVEGTQHRSVTQENGRFLILNVAPGIYRVNASRIGYANASEDNVRVTGGGTAMVELELRNQVLAIEQIVVTGVVDPISGVKVPFTVGRISGDFDLRGTGNSICRSRRTRRLRARSRARLREPRSSARAVRDRAPTSSFARPRACTARTVRSTWWME